MARKEYTINRKYRHLTRKTHTACREDDFRVFLRRTSVLPSYRYFVPQRFSCPLSYFIS